MVAADRVCWKTVVTNASVHCLAIQPHDERRYTQARTGAISRSVFEIQIEVAQVHADTDTGIMITMPVHVVIRYQDPCSVNMLMSVMIVIVASMLTMISIAEPFAMPAFFHMTFM